MWAVRLRVHSPSEEGRGAFLETTARPLSACVADAPGTWSSLTRTFLSSDQQIGGSMLGKRAASENVFGNLDACVTFHIRHKHAAIA